MVDLAAATASIAAIVGRKNYLESVERDQL